MAFCILVVNKVGDEVIEAGFDEVVIATDLISPLTVYKDYCKKAKKYHVFIGIKQKYRTPLVSTPAYYQATEFLRGCTNQEGTLIS